MKSTMLLICFFISASAIAQYSTKQLDELFKYNSHNPVKLGSDTKKESKEKIKLNIADSIAKYSTIKREEAVNELLQQKVRFMESDSPQAKKEFLLDSIDKQIIVTKYYYRNKFRDLRLIKDYISYGRPRTFFPAIYGRESLKFYENDSVHIKLFRNNSINYSPTNNQMILATEIINDYFGPIRIGFGFQIKSNAANDSLSTVDSTIQAEKKLDLVADLKNKGGDINLNLAFPLLQAGSGSAFLSVKASLFNNLGFSLPTFNESSTDFSLNNYGGLNAVIYSRGFLGKISILINGSTGYVSGNKNFRNAIKDANKNDPSSFWFSKLSIGLDFNDTYRLQADLFGGNSFVRENFPATITFTIRPDK